MKEGVDYYLRRR